MQGGQEFKKNKLVWSSVAQFNFHIVDNLL